MRHVVKVRCSPLAITTASGSFVRPEAGMMMVVEALRSRWIAAGSR